MMNDNKDRYLLTNNAGFKVTFNCLCEVKKHSQGKQNLELWDTRVNKKLVITNHTR